MLDIQYMVPKAQENIFLKLVKNKSFFIPVVN